MGTDNRCPHGFAGRCPVQDCGNHGPTFVKHDAEKTMHYLVDPEFVDGLAKVLTHGAKKYSPDNWKNCTQPFARYYSALQRHLTQFALGFTEDEETGLSHLYHAACCLQFLAFFERQGELEER